LIPGEHKSIALTMKPKLTQVTIFTRAPEAEVWIDGVFLGMAGEPVDVSPGAHKVELQAPGYRNIAIAFDIDPGARRNLHLAMLRHVEDPWVIRERGILSHHVFIEAAYGLAFQSGGFSGATAKVSGDDVAPADF